MEELNDKLISYFKNVCLETSKLSTCISKQVGAVLVRNKRIIAIGYNGVPSGEKHCDEIFTSSFDRDKHSTWSKLYEYHAEENIFAFCLREGISTYNSSIFISLSPCTNCSKLIVNSGVKEVYYIEEYDRDIKGLDFLRHHNVKVRKI